MIWESQIQYIAIDNKGNDKVKREKYIFKQGELFGEIESALYDKFGSLSGFEVADIKHSKITEVANARTNEDDLVWIADLEDTFVDENGVEKANRYKIAFYAQTFETAKSFITDYMRQGYQMDLVGLKLTKFEEVI